METAMANKRKILIAIILTIILALSMQLINCVNVRVGSPDTLDTGIDIKKDSTAGPRYRR